ncbi:hypothetical protein F4821DRAFT_116847 [Hypoxylon rubiginosum]|uniref:Uncharacterized protein n=1 Tax=Hypoxylon rubiginosum TaxID=110542 RepID=A0ACC0D3Y6_9PEZI|nr:hypothetical protein F4821DRAFT_116847 [Hypoxylon rubiginosum]
MPRHRSPSPSPAPQRRSLSRYPQSKRSLSINPQPRRRGSSSSSESHSDTGKDVLKTSLVFLGAIGAASLAASKFWPKGILYGDKESWAHEAKEHVKHAVGKDGSSHRSHRRRRSDGHDDHDTRHRRRAVIRDEVVVTRPDGKRMYVDTGWNRHSYDDESRRSSRSSEHIFDARGRERGDSQDDYYEPREARGRSHADR